MEMDNQETEENNVNRSAPISFIIQTTNFNAKMLPSFLLFEQQSPGGFYYEAILRAENEDNILDPIIEYMLNNSDDAYVPPQ